MKAFQKVLELISRVNVSESIEEIGDVLLDAAEQLEADVYEDVEAIIMLKCNEFATGDKKIVGIIPSEKDLDKAGSRL